MIYLGQTFVVQDKPLQKYTCYIKDCLYRNGKEARQEIERRKVDKGVGNIEEEKCTVGAAKNEFVREFMSKR